MLSALRTRIAKSWTLGFARPGPWALMLLVLLVVLNVGGLLVYRSSHTNEPLSLQIWNYLESSTFKLVAGSLILPLLVFLVEGRFNIAETIRKSQEERAQKAQDEREQWRLETVERATQMWNDLYGLATEVVYWEPEKSLPDALARITNFFNQAEATVSSLRIRFPSMYEAYDIDNVLLPLFNTLSYCINSVAVYLGEVADSEERAELQRTLMVIQYGIQSACHRPLLLILERALELEALGDAGRLGGTMDDDAPTREAMLVGEIQAEGVRMAEWVKAIQARESGAETMPLLDDSVAGAFRDAYRSAREWLLANPGRSLSDYEGFVTWQARFVEIPHAALMRAYEVAYSKEWLRELADWFALVAYSTELEERTAAPG